MSATIIGRVKSPSGKSYEVKWDSASKEAMFQLQDDHWSVRQALLLKQ